MSHDVNVPLLRKTLEYITAHPEQHYQGWWASQTTCGTRCCVAGWAVQFAGHELYFEDIVDFGSFPRIRHADTGEDWTFTELAKKELGLTETQAEELFCAAATLPDIYRLANEYTNGEIAIPADLPSR